MDLPSISFPLGVTNASTKIHRLESDPVKKRVFVVLQESCFHPRDFRWPDQPADRGRIEIHGGETLVVQDVAKLCLRPNEDALFDREIQYSRKDMPEGARLVCSLVFPIESLPTLERAWTLQSDIACFVDEQYRQALSVGHSFGHLASFALNEVLAPLWRKPVVLDSRGFPDFIRLTQIDSTVYENGTKDVYRLGKSLRKQGFSTLDLLATLSSFAGQAKQSILAWLERQPHAWMTSDGPALDDSRRWFCRLNEQEFWMFCGGTHICDYSALDLDIFELTCSEDKKSLTLDIRARKSSL